MKFFKNKIYFFVLVIFISFNGFSSEIKNHASLGLSLRSGVVNSSLLTLNLKTNLIHQNLIGLTLYI